MIENLALFNKRAPRCSRLLVFNLESLRRYIYICKRKHKINLVKSLMKFLTELMSVLLEMGLSKWKWLWERQTAASIC